MADVLSSLSSLHTLGRRRRRRRRPLRSGVLRVERWSLDSEKCLGRVLVSVMMVCLLLLWVSELSLVLRDLFLPGLPYRTHGRVCPCLSRQRLLLLLLLLLPRPCFVGRIRRVRRVRVCTAAVLIPVPVDTRTLPALPANPAAPANPPTYPTPTRTPTAAAPRIHVTTHIHNPNTWL